MPHLPLFVYGTLMSDQPAFDLIAPSVVRSVAGMASGLVMYSVGPYPLAAPGVGVIQGEIHWLQPAGYDALLGELERYEGPEYTRVRHVVHEQAKPAHSFDAWLFLGDGAQAALLPLIPTGDWRAWRQHLNRNAHEGLGSPQR